jgi:hypothetical protein
VGFGQLRGRVQQKLGEWDMSSFSEVADDPWKAVEALGALAPAAQHTCLRWAAVTYLGDGQVVERSQAKSRFAPSVL